MSNLSARQTSFQVAGRLVAAAVNTGVVNELDEALAAVQSLSKDIYVELEALAEGGDTKPRAGSGKAPRSRTRSRQRGPVTLDSARETVINFGKFEGETLGDIAVMNEDEAEGFGYTNGSGEDYMEWLTTNKRNPFIAERAKLVLEAAREGDA